MCSPSGLGILGERTRLATPFARDRRDFRLCPSVMPWRFTKLGQFPVQRANVTSLLGIDLSSINLVQKDLEQVLLQQPFVKVRYFNVILSLSHSNCTERSLAWVARLHHHAIITQKWHLSINQFGARFAKGEPTLTQMQIALNMLTSCSWHAFSAINEHRKALPHEVNHFSRYIMIMVLEGFRCIPSLMGIYTLNKSNYVHFLTTGMARHNVPASN